MGGSGIVVFFTANGGLITQLLAALVYSLPVLDIARRPQRSGNSGQKSTADGRLEYDTLSSRAPTEVGEVWGC
jgi:hypothetical protein